VTVEPDTYDDISVSGGTVSLTSTRKVADGSSPKQYSFNIIQSSDTNDERSTGYTVSSPHDTTDIVWQEPVPCSAYVAVAETIRWTVPIELSLDSDGKSWSDVYGTATTISVANGDPSDTFVSLEGDNTIKIKPTASKPGPGEYTYTVT